MGVDGISSADIFDEYFDDEKPKYIIKNCPAMGFQIGYYCSDRADYCKNCTDCVLKQIVEKCNIPNCLCDNCDGVGYFDGCADKDCAFYRIMQIQAKLEIEEVE